LPCLFVADQGRKIVGNLPNPLLIIGALETEDMIRISSRGLCGKDDVGYRRKKEARISAVKGRDSVAPKAKI
jgi:hypothetical protein